MTTVVLLATGWGPKAGGINTFNMELARGLSEVLGDGKRVICVVPTVDPAARRSAETSRVTLVSLDLERAELPDFFDVGWIDRARNRLRSLGVKKVDLYVGHDVVSGGAANAMRDETDDALAVILMHMSYSDYQGVKHGSGQEAHAKEEQQRAVFERADVVLGVGPLLRDRGRDLVGDPVTMLVPGLPTIEPKPPTSRIVALSFGRFEAKNDRIKQIRLAVEGVAEACRRGQAIAGPALLKDNPLIKLIGVTGDLKEQQTLRQWAQKVAKRIVNLQALPYEESRQKMLRHVAEANVSLMLSWHEGFGLTGWESIAGEVPLIVSEQSGLYRLLEAEGLNGFVWPVVVDGSLGDPEDEATPNFTNEDRARVADQIIKIASDMANARGRAQNLKKALVERGFTWAKAARTLLDASKFPRNRPGGLACRTADPSSGLESSVPDPIVEELLEFKERTWSGHLAPPDSVVLRAEYRFVPFHELRRDLLNQLTDLWSQSSEPTLSIRLQIGVGGSGKTRLAIELAALLRARGWCAGFLRDGADPARFSMLFGDGRDVLVVIDYAETRRHDLFATVRAALSAQKPGQRIRILLLARAAGDWWARLPEDADDKEVAAILASPRYTIGPYPLPRLVLEDDERALVYRESRAAFADRLHLDQTSGPEPLLAPDHFAEPLFVHLAALCALRGQVLESAHELIDAALAREREYWKRAVDGVDFQGRGLDGVEQVVALATLVGGARSTSDARRLVIGAPRLRGLAPLQQDRVLDAVRNLYPLGVGIDALRPDLLGERMVHRALSHDDSLIDVVLGATAGERWIRSALTVLTRLARHGGDEAVWLPRALEGEHLQRNALYALNVAAEAGDPLPHVLLDALNSASIAEQHKLIPRLREALPQKTTALQQVAVTVARIWVDIRARAGGGKKGGLELSRAYRDLTMRMIDAGQFQQARANAAKAVELARGFGDPEHVARSLNSFAVTLGNLGLYEEGLEQIRNAEEVCRKIAGVQDTFTLAQVLTNFATFLSETGADEEALRRSVEAEQAWWKISTHDKHSLRQWAMALSNLAGHLCNVGKLADAAAYARKAEKIYCELAEKQPDAHLPEWASSRNKLAAHLSDIGQYDEATKHARDAEEIFCRLAAARPLAYRSDWAYALCTLAVCLSELGQHTEALEQVQRAERIFSTSVVDRAGRLQGPLAESRDVMARQLFHTGDLGQSLKLQLNAVEIWREIVSKRPRTRRGHLAQSLLRVAEVSFRLGRSEDASKYAGDAHTIFLNLAAERPAVYERAVATSRVVVIEAWLGRGNTERAIVEAEAAIAILEKFAFPSVTVEMRVRALMVIARVRKAEGDQIGAFAASSSAAQLLDEEQHRRPKAFAQLAAEVETLRAQFASAALPVPEP